ncbi:hypothetical protein COCOBI_pt-2020 (chloroplast) [Coccomyxa sp. Obi]|nr:hypothetical protein COCOBI_pt-2020 [Coccomyxa sp. Obi]
MGYGLRRWSLQFKGRGAWGRSPPPATSQSAYIWPLPMLCVDTLLTALFPRYHREGFFPLSFSC